MYFELAQTNKELFSANFEIKSSCGSVGSAFLQGRLGSIDGEIAINYGGNTVTLSPGMVEKSKHAAYLFRPYSVFRNGVYMGSIYQTQYKAGWFNKYDYHQAELNGDIYKMFPLGFGQDGAKNPIWCGESQRALVEKDCEIIDDLHIYKITCLDEWAALVSVIFAAYMYVNAGYKPGAKVTNSVHKVISKTTNKMLLEKYDPTFKRRVESESSFW